MSALIDKIWKFAKLRMNGYGKKRDAQEEEFWLGI